MSESVSFSLPSNSTDGNYYILVCLVQSSCVFVYKSILNKCLKPLYNREEVCVSQIPSDKQIQVFFSVIQHHNDNPTIKAI